ncbi:MAG TPA: class I SAM-dependent methyltransferase [Bryobacteraceae bacterium]|nr:class I SAM-dependent methyltransferase [Bryobacteraceae bacterium]
MPDRKRARELAAEFLAKGDPAGWFEHLYQEAERGEASIPWADLQPNPNLMEFWNIRQVPTSGKTALKIGCGLGDDAEQLAAWGFQTTAFDISETAIRACKRRFPESRVQYVAADLLHPPREWLGEFDFVVESYTLQVLPPDLRPRAIARAADLVRAGGLLLVIARGRDEQDGKGQMPWPLTRREVDLVAQTGLREISFEDYYDRETPPVRRFRGLYRKPDMG